MFTLRCTARLLKRMKVAPVAACSDPTTLLGDWYANLIHVGRQQLVLAVSEKTLLPVVVPAAPNSTLATRLRVAVTDVLRTLGIPGGDIDREDAEMTESVYGKTTNKQVLGILVDFARLLPFHLGDGDSLIEASLKLAETPCSPLFKTTTSPDRTTKAVFAGA
jgi:hypothetical protein